MRADVEVISLSCLQICGFKRLLVSLQLWKGLPWALTQSLAS